MSEEKKDIIELVRLAFTRSCVVSIREHIPSQQLAASTNKLDVSRVPNENNELLFQATFQCVMNPESSPNWPYSVDMECVGIFRVDSSVDPEEAFHGVHVTANGVLYGAIRESVANITGRHPFGQLLLGLSHLRVAKKPPEVKE